MKFRRIPQIIDAIQITHDIINDESFWPDWMIKAKTLLRDEPGRLYIVERSWLPGQGKFKTLYIYSHRYQEERVYGGDWIYKDHRGDVHLCRADMFKYLFEPIEENQ